MFQIVLFTVNNICSAARLVFATVRIEINMSALGMSSKKIHVSVHDVNELGIARVQSYIYVLGREE